MFSGHVYSPKSIPLALPIGGKEFVNDSFLFVVGVFYDLLSNDDTLRSVGFTYVWQNS